MKKAERTTPKFDTEAEEAEWWYRNRHKHGRELLAAVRSGDAQVLTKAKLLARLTSPSEASAQADPHQVHSE